MQNTVISEQVNESSMTSIAKRSTTSHGSSEPLKTKKKLKTACGNVTERYCIIVKPKLNKSNSLSDLATNSSDFNLDFLKSKKTFSRNYERFYNSGDADTVFAKHRNNNNLNPYMSWNIKGKKSKNKIEPGSYGAKFANDYIMCQSFDPNILSSTADYSSICSADQTSHKPTFPFKPTPSGHLKIHSNQVVFQSSTVGVLLADPTQAKVKVKFEGKTESGTADEEIMLYENNYNAHNNEQNYHRQHYNDLKNINGDNTIPQHPSRDAISEKNKDLNSLGYYALSEPVDWKRVQLPKKQDLFQEFYRRILNYTNTDILIRIGDEEFHCHRIVLQIYSPYFDVNFSREIDLPVDTINPETFQAIYEWMIFNGADSHRVLKRENVLELFCAAQFLSIKDLEEQCWSFIVNENIFNEDTAFVLFREGHIRGITPVMELMIPRIMNFFLPLVASKDFLELDSEEILIILKSNYICVTSEIEVLMAGIRWLYGNWSLRKQYAVNVMSCVRFGLISPWQLVDIKRNPDNAEILEIVNDPDVQQMVDDGLAYVIIKYWYGNNSKNYYHWIDVLGLSEPAERNWIGEEKNHVTYKDFLNYLEQFMIPKEQMYQQMSMMQQVKRKEDVPGSFRGMDSDSVDIRKPKMDFPLAAALKGFTGKDKFPNMSEFFENRKKENANCRCRSPSPLREPVVQQVARVTPDVEKPHNFQQKHYHEITSNLSSPSAVICGNQYDAPVKDVSPEEMANKNHDSSDTSSYTSSTTKVYQNKRANDLSVAACYLATATAALSGSRSTHSPPPAKHYPTTMSNAAMRANTKPDTGLNSTVFSPQISLFNQSKESLARVNMNKLSTSILGPSNKDYIADGSLFNWDRETVLVFGGIDPHTPYGVGKNTGKDIYRFDPVTNVWEGVGELPEPRHHHSVAFLKGKIYLVGGADPRDDEMRGKSMVVSTVWSYEPVKRAWYNESGLATPRKNFGLVVHRMALYAIGGQDKKGRVLRSVEKYDPKTGAWNEVSSMAVARVGVASTKYREYIWVAGGMTGERKKPLSRVVECYNSKTDQWTKIHSLRFPRCFATLFSMNDKLYLIGGAGKTSEKDKATSSIGNIDLWDWNERKWQQLTEMSIPRHGHALAYLGTQLIIIGGVTTVYMRALNNVESFCCERGAWIRGVAALPSPLSGHGAVTLPPASLM